MIIDLAKKDRFFGMKIGSCRALGCCPAGQYNMSSVGVARVEEGS